MTTELILLALSAFVITALILQWVYPTFENSAPRLATKIEKRIAVGHNFEFDGGRIQWQD